MMSMKRPDHQGLYVGKISKLMKGKISFTAQEDTQRRCFADPYQFGRKSRTYQSL